MEQVVVKIDNLVKRYKELIALDHFSLEIREGEIFGLLGPNGSGKTTTINCLLSLLSFDKGKIEIFGKEMSPVQYDIKRQIGVIMQNVAVFQELTVYENIDYFCGLYIRDKATRKQYVMDAVHFTGLEKFLKFYPKKLSCTRIAIMDQGKKIAEGTKEELKQIIKNTETITIEVPMLPESVLQSIKALEHVYQATYEQEELKVYCSGGMHNLVDVLHILQEQQVAIGRVYTTLPTLNDVFLEITGKALRDQEG